MATKKYLHKSKTNKKVFGVFGGIGEHYNIDPTLLRLIWIAIVVFTCFAPGIIAYIIAALVMPSTK
jgi:phage shock protein C